MNGQKSLIVIDKMKVLLAGDYCPRDRILRRIVDDDTESILSGVKPYIVDSDLAIVNFECPVIKEQSTPILKNGPSLFCPEKSALLIKQAGFNLVTLANNHFYDQGDAGVIDTINTIESYGIDYVGGGRDLDEASKTYYFEKGNEKIAIINCCEHEFSIATDNSGGSNPLNPVFLWYKIQEAKNQADYVLVIVHGGHEQYNLPSPRMKETYRFFIDAGANAVVNHHQHCYSGYEVYQGKPIFYGLGNFCMDDPRYRNSKWNYGFMVQFSFSDKVSFELIPYSQGNDIEDVAVLENNQYEIFLQNISILNEIISDDKKLNEAYTIWISCSRNAALLPFMPYSTKLARYMAIKGYLPSKPAISRIISILNKVDCESHRDKLLYILKDTVARFNR